jgi:hypothetical protein
LALFSFNEVGTGGVVISGSGREGEEYEEQGTEEHDANITGKEIEDEIVAPQESPTTSKWTSYKMTGVGGIDIKMNNNNRITRKSDTIKFIDTSAITSALYRGPTCQKCMFHGLLVQIHNGADYRCGECGAITPGSQVKHERSLQRPLGTLNVNRPLIYQAENQIRGRDRRPDSMIRKKPNAAEEWVQARGFQVTDSTSNDQDVLR